jgi:prepilin-type N-terminal cleavage/methylation domain-containing protein
VELMICSPFKKKNFGFTLIELLIVIAIIAILTTFGAASYSRIQKGSHDTQRKADLKKVAGALEQFYSDFDRYPNSSNGTILDADCSRTASGTFGESLRWGQDGMHCRTVLDDPSTERVYLQNLPADPRNSGKFIYFYSSTGAQIYCLADHLETETHTLSCGGANYDYVVTPND